jgi:hypothetical protein
VNPWMCEECRTPWRASMSMCTVCGNRTRVPNSRSEAAGEAGYAEPPEDLGGSPAGPQTDAQPLFLERLKDRVAGWWRLWWDETLIIIGVSAAICLVIWGCWYLFQMQAPSLAEGVVQEHQFTAEYEETHDGGTTCYGRDKNGACTFSVRNPDIHHVHCVGGCYYLVVNGCTERRRGDMYCRNETKTVDQLTYNNCRDGQYWIRGRSECSLR